MATKRYVRPVDGGWDIVPEGHHRSLEQRATEKEAVARARQLARRDGGGEIRVLNAQGKVIAAASVAAPRSRTRTRAA